MLSSGENSQLSVGAAASWGANAKKAAVSRQRAEEAAESASAPTKCSGRRDWSWLPLFAPMPTGCTVRSGRRLTHRLAGGEEEAKEKLVVVGKAGRTHRGHDTGHDSGPSFVRRLAPAALWSAFFVFNADVASSMLYTLALWSHNKPPQRRGGTLGLFSSLCLCVTNDCRGRFRLAL